MKMKIFGWILELCRLRNDNFEEKIWSSENWHRRINFGVLEIEEYILELLKVQPEEWVLELLKIQSEEWVLDSLKIPPEERVLGKLL